LDRGRALLRLDERHLAVVAAGAAAGDLLLALAHHELAVQDDIHRPALGPLRKEDLPLRERDFAALGDEHPQGIFRKELQEVRLPEKLQLFGEVQAKTRSFRTCEPRPERTVPATG